MDHNSRYKQQVNNIKEHTDNPAIVNDVVDSEFEQYPVHNEKQNKFTSVEKVARNNIDGKTWADKDDYSD